MSRGHILAGRSQETDFLQRAPPLRQRQLSSKEILEKVSKYSADCVMIYENTPV